MKIATVFSGIGAVEHALKRLYMPHKIVFACDNGGINPWFNYTKDEISEIKEYILSVYENKKRKQIVDELYRKTKEKNFVQKSYLANYELSESFYYQDICFINGMEYENEIDLFVGGSPCQPFSVAGPLTGLNDTRGTLFYEFARLIHEMKPKVFIYENVENLIHHDKGKTWKIIKNTFESLNYHLFYKVLNAVDYGIPQSRKRIFVIGFRDKCSFEFPEPIPLTKTMQDFLIDNCKSLYYLPCDNPIEQTLDEKYFLSEKMVNYVLAPGTKSYMTKPTIDTKIAKTIVSTMHKMHRASIDNYVTTNGRLRRLTPREALRLMGFCDSFKQVVSDNQMYRQAGNSIVVDVLMHLLMHIIETK